MKTNFYTTGEARTRIKKLYPAFEKEAPFPMTAAAAINKYLACSKAVLEFTLWPEEDSPEELNAYLPEMVYGLTRHTGLNMLMLVPDKGLAVSERCVRRLDHVVYGSTALRTVGLETVVFAFVMTDEEYQRRTAILRF